MSATRRSDLHIPDDVLAEADAYAKVRNEAMRSADNSTGSRREAFLEIAEYCDQQEQVALHRGKRRS